MLFDRFSDIPVASAAYQQVLAGSRIPAEWANVPVVDMGQLSANFRFAEGTPEQQLAYQGVAAVLGQKHPMVLSSVLGQSQMYNKLISPQAFFLAIGYPGSPGGLGGTIRAMWQPGDQRVAGLFGLTLRALSVSSDGDVLTEPLVGFRLLLNDSVANEVVAIWERLAAHWPNTLRG